MTDRQDKYPALHRGHAGKSADSRARSLAGLKRGNVVHGAKSATLTAPIAKRERRRLRQQFPSAAKTSEGAELVRASASRLALIERYLGHVSDEKAGPESVAAAARETRLLLAQHERAVKRLAELDRQAGTVSSSATLEAIQAEYSTRSRGVGDESGGGER
jgi:hypothetical protein